MSDLFHIAPILVAGAFALAIILERARALYQVLPMKDSNGFSSKLKDLVLRGKNQEAISLCDQYPTKPEARVYKSALTRAHLPDESIQQGLEITLGECVREVQKRISYLAMVANVATLLGLFGTIVGLIHSFEAVGHADATQKSALLAQGIATSMNATMLGLAVAIPCMIAFSLLTNKSNRLISELDESAVKAMDALRLSMFVEESEKKSA